MAIRVAIQERQRFLRDGLAMLLTAEPDIEVVGAAASARDLSALCDEHRPDVVLLELDADEWDACRLITGLRARHRAVRVVGLHRDGRLPEAGRAFQAGLRAILSHGAGGAAVLSAVRGTSPERPVVAPLHDTPADAPRHVLTAREVEVLGQIACGRTTREISGRLGIAPKTVENHKQRIFAKLGVQNQAHAVAVALREGLVAPRFDPAADGA